MARSEISSKVSESRSSCIPTRSCAKRESGKAEAVKRLHLESLLQQEPVGLAHRAADDAPPRIARGDLVLAADRERPSCDLNAPGLDGAPLVLTLRELLSEIALLVL